MSACDALVIGGGPAGLAAALCLCRAGQDVVLAETLALGGHLLRTAEVDDSGLPRLAGWEFADKMAAQLEGQSIVRRNEAVTAFVHKPGANTVTVGSETFTARTVIICTGTRPKPLGLEGEDRLYGRGLSTCAVCDGNFFRDLVVGVVGGGEKALEESLYLATLVQELHLITRGEHFQAPRPLQDRVRATPNIRCVLHHAVRGLEGDAALEGLVLEDLHTHATTRLPLEGLFVFAGVLPNIDALPQDLDRDPNGFIRTDADMRTNLPGVFAAGDVRAKLCRRVVTAVGEGTSAACAACDWLAQQTA